MKLRPLSFSVLTAGCIAASATGTALAAEGDDSAAGSSRKLEEVVVTAEKRSESILDVPLSVSAVDASELTSAGNVQLKDYFAQVPGLSVAARGSGRLSIVLRGIATDNSGNPTVGVTLDNAPFGASASFSQMVPDIDPFDLDHIEVLRGPQGTLYGASSIGGLLKYVLAKPDTAGFSARAEVGTSSTAHGDEGYSVRGAVNLPLSDSFALRMSGFHREDAGYVQDVGQNRNDVNGQRISGGRVSALWRLNDAVTIQSSAMLQDSKGDATSDVDVNFSYQPLYGAYAHQRLAGTDGFDARIHFYDTTVSANLGWGTLESTSAYSQLRHIGPQDVTGTFGRLVPFFYPVTGAGVVIDNNYKFHQFSQELRLSSPDDGRAFEWLYGLFYVDNNSEGFQRLRVANINSGADLGFAPLYTGTSPAKYQEYAAFTNLGYRFTERFDVQVGARYGADDQDSSSPTDGPLNGGFSNAIGSSSEHPFTWQVTPRFRITDDVNVYTRVATGYRPGGPNALIPGLVIPTSYDADKTVNYELGLKGDFFGHTLTLQTAVFYIDWKDIQILLTDQATGYSYITNGGTAKSQGAEASIHWNPAEGLGIDAALAYTDAKLTEDLDSGTGFNGDRLPFSSKTSGSVSARQSFRMSGELSAYVGAGISYVGERLGSFGKTPATPRFRLPGYATTDVRGGLEGADWAVNLYVRNITDRWGFVNAQARNATSGISAYGVSLIQPRTVGISLNKSW